MTTGQGHCKHGKFQLNQGCPQCVADRMAEEGNTEASIAEAVKAADRHIVKVQYYSESQGGITSDREYTYYSVDRLSVGDVVWIPVRGRQGKGKVSAVDVSPAEIINFADKVKTIPSGSKIQVKPEQEEMEAGLNAEGLTLFGEHVGKPIEITEALLEETETKTLPASELLPETAVALRPGEDIEAQGYYAEALGLLKYAEARVIATIDDVKLASNDLVPLSKLKKAMEAKKREYLDPLRDQAEAIRETYSCLMDPIIRAEKITKDKMLAYDAEQKRIRAEQERINQQRFEAAQAEMKLKGELSEPVNLVELTPEAPKRVRTNQGLSSYTDCWKWEVIDFALLPDDYKVVDGPLLTDLAKKNHDKKPIPGVRFYNDPIISVRG